MSKRKIIDAWRLAMTVAAAALCLQTAAQETPAHPWRGKRVAYFGDSITDPNNKAAATKYWHLLQQWLGITPYVYAVSGRQWNDIPRQAGMLASDHGDDFDAIIILMGTNDFNNGVPIGQWFTETREDVYAAHGGERGMVTRQRRHIALTDTTYCGRINIAIDTLKRLFPTKQIVLLTPIHRAGFFPNENNWQPAEDYANSCGEYVSAYVEAVKEAANVWALPVIDLNAACGLYPLEDSHAQYFNKADTDRLHPNDLGHRRIALTLVYQLAALPCSF